MQAPDEFIAKHLGVDLDISNAQSLAHHAKPSIVKPLFSIKSWRRCAKVCDR